MVTVDLKGQNVDDAPEKTPSEEEGPSDTLSEESNPSETSSETLEGEAETPPDASHQHLSEESDPSETSSETLEGEAETPPDASHQQMMAGAALNDNITIDIPPEGGEGSETQSGGGGEEELPASDALKMIMAALKIRSRVFTEGIMTMACPVILAITRDIVKEKIDRSNFGRFIILSIAMLAFEIGIVQFLVVCLPSTVNNWLCKVSKVLIHLCVVLMMFLASLVMSLIGLPNFGGYLLVMGIIGVFTIYMGYVSWREDDKTAKMNETTIEELKGPLDISANFSAAVTAVLFLGMEFLALEELMSAKDHELQRMLTFPLGSSFWTWVSGLVTMLLVSVHPLIYPEHMMSFLGISSAGLAIGVCVVLYSITAQAMGEKRRFTILFVAVPWLPFVAGCGYVLKDWWFDTNSDTQKEEELEPASLELTKITFAAFLAVTVAAAKETPSPTNYFTMVMVFKWFSATAIVTGLEWRLVTHLKKVPHAVARGADFANFISHLCMACAVIPLAVLATEAVNKASEVAT